MHAHFSCLEQIIIATISKNEHIVNYYNAFVNHILQTRCYIVIPQ